MPRVTFAQSGPAADADQLARIMKSFEGTTEVRYESFERPEAAAACGPSPLFSSMFHKLSTTLDGDQESRDRIETLRRSFTDPQAAARLGREEVRRLLDRRGLPLEPVGGTVVEYPSARGKGRGAPPSLATSTGERDDTLPLAVEKAARQQQGSRWLVSFVLAYPPSSRHNSIPLDPSYRVDVRIEEDRVELSWDELPTSERLPPESELSPNVTPEQAFETARADFLRRVGDPTLSDTDIDSSRPRQTVWFGTDGPGRLAWDLSVTVKPRMVKPHLASYDVHYQIEARTTAGGEGPRILNTFSPRLNGLTGVVLPDRVSPVN